MGAHNPKTFVTELLKESTQGRAGSQTFGHFLHNALGRYSIKDSNQRGDIGMDSKQIQNGDNGPALQYHSPLCLCYNLDHEPRPVETVRIIYFARS